MDVVNTSIGDEAGNNKALVCYPILTDNYNLHQWKPKNTVVKYTKIPNFDLNFESTVWPKHDSYVLAPHLRRIVTIEEEQPFSSRSLKPTTTTTMKNKEVSNLVPEIKRKVVSMMDKQEPKTGSSAKTNCSRRQISAVSSQRSNKQKSSDQTTFSKFSPVLINEINRAPQKSTPSNSNNTVTKAQKAYVNRISKFKKMLQESETYSRGKHEYIPIIASQHDIHQSNVSSRKGKPVKTLETPKSETSSRKISPPRKSDIRSRIVNTVQSKSRYQSWRNTSHHDSNTSSMSSRSPTLGARSPVRSCNRAQGMVDNFSHEDYQIDTLFTKPNKNHVADNIKMVSKPKSPRQIESKVNTSLVKRYKRNNKDINSRTSSNNTTTATNDNMDSKVAFKTSKEVDKASNEKGNNRTLHYIECGTSYETSLTYKEENTNTDIVMKSDVTSDTADLGQSKSATTLVIEGLHIPDVTLVKDKHRNVDPLASSRSWPDLKIPPLRMSPTRRNSQEETESSNNSFTHMIGRATVTYMTKHQIDFQVHDKGSTTPVDSSRFSYPCSVVTLFKKDVCISNPKQSHCSMSSINKKAQKNAINKLKWKTNSCVLNEDKLVKPSNIVSSIRLVNVLLEDDFISEQFQRELNFIDTFFESLQYLENSSYSYKGVFPLDFSRTSQSAYLKCNNSIDCSDMSNVDKYLNESDANTATSKSLCLLNNLIQDEQKRAKNLLFVLKMRENALKDFTKSQIIWLENKKKIENIDVSTLKKKQRGALLKLQHECGEMNRMRKALLRLSEKRKEELIKTKKNIESKLSTNNVDYNSLLSDKKRIRKSTSMDRQISPLKCFELSNSWDECYSGPKLKYDGNSYTILKRNSVLCEEKCIQTSFSNYDTQSDKNAEIVSENSIVVDGKYLNILFQSLSLPEIFKGGKSYEVNEAALNNIVASGKQLNNAKVSNFVNQIKNVDEKSTSPSTARSLLEELEQCYKNMFEDASSESVNSEKNIENTERLIRELETNVDTGPVPVISVVPCDDADDLVRKVDCDKSLPDDYDEVNEVLSQPGPLPVPVGEPAVTPSEEYIIPSSTQLESISEEPVKSPPKVDNEAELLLKQQLAIEREIKALEQQEKQLLIVREIPDKPPPPYMPPNDDQPPAPVSPCKFTLSYVNEQLVRDAMDETAYEDTHSHPFNAFLSDFCKETIERHKSVQVVKPWDFCRKQSKSQEDDREILIKNTTEELKDVLLGAPKAVVVSGVRSGRTDHIEDILFSKWHQCESEWTSLHIDETGVKKQVFNSILDKLLTETIHEYRAIANK